MSYKTTLGIETPEPDEPPAATGQLKAMAEQVDLLLRKLTFHPGDLRLTAIATLEEGWLECEGQAVSRTTYKALFEAIGTVYGAGNGSTTFNVPNYVERVPMGPGTTNKLGAKLGAATVALTTAQLASHTHTATDSGHTHTATDSGHTHASGNGIGFLDSTGDYFKASNATGESVETIPYNVGESSTTASGKASVTNASAKANVTNASTGDGEAHNNIQPSTVCNVWIKT